MTTCATIQQQLLNDQSDAKVTSHLRTCRQCTAYARALALLQTPDSSGEPSPSLDNLVRTAAARRGRELAARRRGWRLVLLPALAAAAALALAALVNDWWAVSDPPAAPLAGVTYAAADPLELIAAVDDQLLLAEAQLAAWDMVLPGASRTESTSRFDTLQDALRTLEMELLLDTEAPLFIDPS